MVDGGVTLKKGRSRELGQARIRVLSTGDNPICHVTLGHRSGPCYRDQGSHVGIAPGHMLHLRHEGWDRMFSPCVFPVFKQKCSKLSCISMHFVNKKMKCVADHPSTQTEHDDTFIVYF